MRSGLAILSTTAVLALSLSGLPLLAAESGKPELPAPPASLALSPNRVLLELSDAPVTESATLMNLSDHPITVDTQLVTWDLDDNSEYRELAADSSPLPGAIILNPTQFTIPEGGSQTVRFMVMPERIGAPGEHRGMLFFNELVDTDYPGIKMRYRLGLPIYVRLGEPDFSMTLHSVELATTKGKPSLSFDIEAQGNAHVRPRGYYVAWPTNQFPGDSRAKKRARKMFEDPGRKLPAGAQGGNLHPRPVMPGTRRVVSAPLDLQPAEQSAGYKVAVYLQSETERVSRVLSIDY